MRRAANNRKWAQRIDWANVLKGIGAPIHALLLDYDIAKKANSAAASSSNNKRDRDREVLVLEEDEDDKDRPRGNDWACRLARVLLVLRRAWVGWGVWQAGAAPLCNATKQAFRKIARGGLAVRRQ
jgi:hypothetical protein